MYVVPKPGRVVTLLRTSPDEEMERCYGMVYRVEAEDKSDVLAYLDFREKVLLVQMCR